MMMMLVVVMMMMMMMMMMTETFRKSSCGLLKSLLGLLDPYVEGTNGPSKRRALFAQLHGVVPQNTCISIKLRIMKLS